MRFLLMIALLGSLTVEAAPWTLEQLLTYAEWEALGPQRSDHVRKYALRCPVEHKVECRAHAIEFATDLHWHHRFEYRARLGGEDGVGYGFSATWWESDEHRCSTSLLLVFPHDGAPLERSHWNTACLRKSPPK